MFDWLTFKVLGWISAALGVAVLTLGAFLWAANVRIDQVALQRDKARDEVAKAKDTIKGQIELLRQCDAATKALDAEGRKRQAEAEKAVAVARSEAGRYQQEVKRLRGLQGTPTPSGADCRQALREIRK